MTGPRRMRRWLRSVRAAWYVNRRHIDAAKILAARKRAR